MMLRESVGTYSMNGLQSSEKRRGKSVFGEVKGPPFLWRFCSLTIFKEHRLPNEKVIFLTQGSDFRLFAVNDCLLEQHIQKTSHSLLLTKIMTHLWTIKYQEISVIFFLHGFPELQVYNLLNSLKHIGLFYYYLLIQAIIYLKYVSSLNVGYLLQRKNESQISSKD